MARCKRTELQSGNSLFLSAMAANFPQPSTDLHRHSLRILLTPRRAAFILRRRLNRKLRNLMVRFSSHEFLTVFEALDVTGELKDFTTGLRSRRLTAIAMQLAEKLWDGHGAVSAQQPNGSCAVN